MSRLESCALLRSGLGRLFSLSAAHNEDKFKKRLSFPVENLPKHLDSFVNELLPPVLIKLNKYFSTVAGIEHSYSNLVERYDKRKREHEEQAPATLARIAEEHKARDDKACAENGEN